jgi:hypothetical protein
MFLINLTPHPITICTAEGTVVQVIERSHRIARLKTETVTVKELFGVPITKTVFGDAVDLPGETWEARAAGHIVGYEGSTAAVAWARFHEHYGFDPDTCELTHYFIVSQLIKSAFPDRHDLLVPAEVVRDSDGNIIGCKSLGI